MSTRWYPLYRAGNPQLRVFLPNFWVKMVKPEIRLPPYMYQFHVSPEMTEYDVKNYLTKLYNLPVVHVRTEILMGSLGAGVDGGILKKDDVRLAHVTLSRDSEPFVFPEVTAADQRKKENEELIKGIEDLKMHPKQKSKLNVTRPGWF